MTTLPAGREAAFLMLVLSRIPGLGPARINAIISRFGGSPDLLHAGADDFQRITGIGEQLSGEIAGFLRQPEKRRAAEQEAIGQFEALERCNARLVTILDPGYPSLLKEIYDPPPVLFIRGSLPNPEQPSIAVVGTRKASAYGKQASMEISGELALRGVLVVSGLAYGIDSAAHEAALRAGGKTVAVLAGGVDDIYTDPRGRLWPKIIEQGALVSEEWFGSEMLPAKFPKRNRIISGMTQGTLVVESDLKGGALITASYALEQNREVFAVPGSIYSGNSRGTNRLIQTGQAKAVLSVDDILEELPAPPIDTVKQQQEPAIVRAELSREENELMRFIGEEPVHLDTLALRSGLDISVLLVLLFELELKKTVRQLPGQFFQKTRRHP
ncbi:DNA-processing protein DprA [Chlorobium sp.]|uniref:DNA-processing protein DprA n=1 Tax=Chlorobium sp. TaxID=1095 RepID=UPI003C4CB87B